MWTEGLFDFFVTIIPQSFALILLFFSLLDIKIEKKTFSLFSIGISFIPYLLKPYVGFGIHSILTMFAMVLIAVVWAKSNLIKSIMYAILSFAVAYVCEWITFVSLEMSKFDISLLETNTQLRVLLGLIPLFALLAVGLTVYYIKKSIKKKEVSKNDVV
jgi:hypothetical protein